MPARSDTGAHETRIQRVRSSISSLRKERDWWGTCFCREGQKRQKPGPGTTLATRIADKLSSSMSQNFTLYTIHYLSDPWEDDPFDLSRLPLDIAEGVRLEELAPLLRADAFDYVTTQMGTWAVQKLKESRYALIHRYEEGSKIVDGDLVEEHEVAAESDQLVRLIAACLRLIRPTRQRTEAMHGKVREDATLDIFGFDHPLDLMETPQNQKLFHIRNKDADNLIEYAPKFLQVMRGNFWKFRMATQFHQLGHFQHWDFKARYLLWASAIESLYTSNSNEHRGSLVAKERIKWFLGESNSIYPKGELSSYETDPKITVGSIIGPMYTVRNFLAHGDRIPDMYFKNSLRTDINSEPLNVLTVLFEGMSFIIRNSLLKILRDGLHNCFAGARESEAYFGSAGLAKTAIKKKLGIP